MDQVEGRQPVLEALRSGRPVRRLILAAESRPAPVVREILDEAARLGVPVERVEREEIARRARSRNPQGVIALTEPFRYAEIDDAFARAGARGEPVLLVALDQVTDPHNVGAIARSAEAAGAHGLILQERRSAAVTPAVEKAAAGALAWLPVIRVTNLASTLEELRRRDVWIAALSGDGSTTLWDLGLAAEPLCLVLGAEGGGVSRLVKDRSDVVISIPMAGQVGSLNVSVAGGVALFEVLRLRGGGRTNRA